MEKNERLLSVTNRASQFKTPTQNTKYIHGVPVENVSIQFQTIFDSSVVVVLTIVAGRSEFYSFDRENESLTTNS